jgi:cytochrome c oxidase subunit IV
MKFLFSNNLAALIILISLTFISVALAQSSLSTAVVAVLATLFVMIKAQQIIDNFMGLYNAPKPWRRLFLAYGLLIPIILALIVYS